jgi:hypothetical protein
MNTVDTLPKVHLGGDSPISKTQFEQDVHKDEEHTASLSTENDSAACKSRKKYSVISQDAREKLLDLVLKKRMRIKEAAKLCNLKFSTSKAILATYRKEGRVGKKKTRARKTKVINTLIVAEVNPFDPSQTKIIPMMSVSETKLLPNQVTAALAEGKAKEAGDRSPREAFNLLTKGKKAANSPTAGSANLFAQTEAIQTELKSLEISESMKQMLEITAYNSKMSLLNEIQGMISKMNAGSTFQNVPMLYLQNSLQNLNIQYKSTLDGLHAKRKHGSLQPTQPVVTLPTTSMPAIPQSQQQPQTPTIIKPKSTGSSFKPPSQSSQQQPHLLQSFPRAQSIVPMQLAGQSPFLPQGQGMTLPPFRMAI